MKYLFLVLILYLMVSCNRNGVAKSEISSFMANPIIMPSNPDFIRNGHDTTINDFFNNVCKVVIYSDSTSCNSCIVSKLYMWQDLIDYSMANWAGKLRFCFIFNPPINENIRLTLRSTLLEYPMIVDSPGEFERLNPHLPKNKALHTFLLDENNNVILVGNPLYNNEIEKMFYKEVEKRIR